MEAKIHVTKYVAPLYIRDMNGLDIDQACNYLQSIKSIPEATSYESLKLRYDCYREEDWYVYGTRLETDDEFEKRINALQKRRDATKRKKLAQEEAERKTYERLKTKFESV